MDKFNTETTTGLRYRGLIPGRNRDTIGLGLVYSQVSNHYNDSLLLDGLPVLGSERMVELNYRMQLTPW